MPIDYKNYPADWKQRRERILLRAAHTCEHCTVSNYSITDRHPDGSFSVLHVAADFSAARAWRKATQRGKIVVLTIAHLDHDEWNHEVQDDRLAALCQWCHFEYDRADNARRKKYGKNYAKYQLIIPTP